MKKHQCSPCMAFCLQLKRWVERGKEHEAAQEVANAAPPKLSASAVPVAPVPRWASISRSPFCRGLSAPGIQQHSIASRWCLQAWSPPALCAAEQLVSELLSQLPSRSSRGRSNSSQSAAYSFFQPQRAYSSILTEPRWHQCRGVISRPQVFLSRWWQFRAGKETRRILCAHTSPVYQLLVAACRSGCQIICPVRFPWL